MSNAFNRIALDPDNSVVVEACAGSGKTWLLVSRIVRLLLAGSQPSEILAITFTRKAAQEMEARLREWLRLLAQGSDQEVRQFLREREVAEQELPRLLPVARGLFEQVLTAQPGITISTFHGWFLQLVQRAPLSASLGDASLSEQTSALLEEAWQSFAEDLQDNPHSEAAVSLNQLFRDYGLSNTRGLLLAFVQRRAEWWAFTQGQRDPVQFATEQLRSELGVEPERDIVGELHNNIHLREALREYASLLGRNTDKDKTLASALVAAESAEPADWLDAVREVIFTTSGSLRKRSASEAQAKRLGSGAESRLLELHQQLGERIEEAVNALAEQAAYRFNLAGLRCGAALLAHYQRLKQQRQQIDFTDVEWNACQLLTNSAHAEYMQYKLDARYRHILLDEFQDTNPLQWQAMRAWLEASVAAERRPQVFLVGDPKQSIYRFRRAEARLFDMAARYLETAFDAKRLSQHVTRRNAPTVLAAVNAVFGAEAEWSEALHFEAHHAHHAELSGQIEVLPLPEIPDTEIAAEAWRNPLLSPLALAPDRRREEEARQLAHKINEVVGAWQVADAQGGQRVARYADIMVLTRSRTHLAVYEQALKAAHIPYVSSRQGGLLEALEVSDLSALLQFLITPFVDLPLAQVLRSPLFACSDEDLMQLAATEPASAEQPASENAKQTWWQRLCQAVERDAVSDNLRRAQALLARWQGMTDQLPVHDLLDRIYFEGEVEARYQTAVPAELRAGVVANLREFIQLALNLDSGRYPSLPRFLDELATLRRAAAQESPDEGTTADGGDAVRIFTVHGAKGLEAPIVWLLGADAGEGRNDHYGVVLDWPPEQSAPRHFSLYGRKEQRGRARAHYFETEALLEAREDLNLLYVAMTRARQVLFVSGCGAKRGGDSWYAKLARTGAGLAQDAGDWPIGTLQQVVPTAAASGQTRVVPDALAAPIPTGSRQAPEISAARRYGIQLHALLELMAPPRSLHDKPGLQHLLDLSDDAFAPLWQDANELLGSAALQRFFDPAHYLCAYNEVSYCDAEGMTRRIDRLVEFADAVWVLDYKTREVADVRDQLRAATPYRGQMLAYRAAMEKIYPAKPVRCALIFKGGQLVEVSPPTPAT